MHYLNMKNAIVAFATFILFGCQPEFIPQAERSNQQAAILNGRTATQSEIGATVALLEYGDPICSGTLISPRVVLTAAHCLSNVRSRNMEVVAGSLDAENAPNSNRHDVDRHIPHENFDEFGDADSNDSAGLSVQNDIGLVILDAPITNVQPAAIPSMESLNTLFGGDEVVISGFGITSLSSNNIPDLQIATTLFIRRSATEILAGGPADTCYGDSGGPIYLDRNGERFVIGATSRGAHDAQIECGENGIYTLAPAYLDWIEENAGELFEGGENIVPQGQCAGRCGSTFPTEGNCYCDAACVNTGDCCPDYQSECGEIDEEEPLTEEPVAEEPVAEEPVGQEPVGQEPVGQEPENEEPENEEPENEEPENGSAPPDDAELQTQGTETPPTGTWTCDISRFVDEVCDCGCGVVDPACADSSISSCEELHCDSGLVYDNTNSRCMGETQALMLEQSCAQSNKSMPFFSIFALLLFALKPKCTN